MDTGAASRQIGAVFFDVSGTLWDRAACDRQVMEIVLPRFRDRLPEEDAEQIIRRFNAVLFGLPTRQHLRESRPFSRLRRFEGLLQSYDVRARSLAREMAHMYDTTRRLTIRQFLQPEAPGVLRGLQAMGVQRGVLVNGAPAFQRHLLDTLGLRPLLDHVVLAEIEGYPKPDVRAFRRAIELTGLEPDQVLYVGDSPTTDVLGASRAGMVTVWFHRPGRRIPRGFPTPDFTVSSLSEVADIVES